jgi:hypothetical protein
MHENNSPIEPNPFLFVSTLCLIDRGGATVPFTNSEFDSAILISFNSSSGQKT